MNASDVFYLLESKLCPRDKIIFSTLSKSISQTCAPLTEFPETIMLLTSGDVISFARWILAHGSLIPQLSHRPDSQPDAGHSRLPVLVV